MRDKKWKIVGGLNHVLIIASHNFPHIRKDKIKKRDTATGAVVENLCAETQSWGIISTSTQKDPNWYVYSPFRLKIKKLIYELDIKVIYDIHGRKINSPKLVEYLPNVPFSILFGNLLQKLPTKAFKKNSTLTFSEDLERMSVPALEIEIRKDARIIDSYEYKLAIDQIKDIINKAKTSFEPEDNIK